MKITVIGDLLYDCFIWADRLPRKGETVSGYRSGFFASGKGGNQAAQAAKLGADTFMIGKVGCDERGKILIHTMQTAGVYTEFITEDPKENTGTDCVLVDKDGNNAIIVAPQANSKITVEEVRRARAVIESSDVLLSQLQINEEAITEALTIAHEAGVTTVLNPAPARAIPKCYYELADYITPNETEAEFFTGILQKDYSENEWIKRVTEEYHKLGAKNVILTLGEKGCVYAGRESRFRVPAFPVEAVDSTAAGDSFNAAFCVSLASGMELREALAYANAAGALTASKHGSLPSLPDKDDVTEFMKRRKTL